jgi:hypothetical protein
MEPVDVNSSLLCIVKNMIPSRVTHSEGLPRSAQQNAVLNYVATPNNFKYSTKSNLAEATYHSSAEREREHMKW